ncbi:MAG: DegT/DnrJ/EryC1/StrS family aminotransferase, partial [Aggregatilineales bacterium]
MDNFSRRYTRLVGRGTTALYVAFRALAEVNGGPGEIIVPDLICSTALDAVLLAGHTPVFADVLPNRWTLDLADARRKVTPNTRAVLVAHLFGHIAAVPRGAFADLGVPIIEDAVQGLGGAVGTLGDVTVIGFAPSKMIGGRGGVVLTDDPVLWDAIGSVSITEQVVQIPTTSERLRGYVPQLTAVAPDLIRPFDDSAANVTEIEAGWADLAANVRVRNEKAAYLHDQLRDTPLMLPDILPGDAIW